MSADGVRDPEVELPKHYDGDGCMVALETAGWGRAGCLFNIGKYLWRMGAKGDPIKDAEKALWYAKRFSDNRSYGAAISPEEMSRLKACSNRGMQRLTGEEAERCASKVIEITQTLGSEMAISSSSRIISVRDRVDSILRDYLDDPEAAHSREDDLVQEIVEAASRGENVQAVALEAMRLLSAERDMWYA